MIQKILLLIVWTALIFALGVFYGQNDDTKTSALRTQVKNLSQQAENVTSRNEVLKETLQLVRRQIQTDRMAYEALQQSIIKSEKMQADLAIKLKKQKERLDKIGQQ